MTEAFSVKDEARLQTPIQAWIFIGIFCLWIVLPAAVQLAGWSSTKGENRTLAAAPEWPTNRAEFETFPQRAQTYLDDHFGLRRQLVWLNSRLRYALGVSASPHVAIGENNFLFYTYEPERLVQQHIGLDVFSPEGLTAWLDKMQENARWLKERGIEYYVVIAPDKSSIYPEYLTDYPTLPNATTRLAQISAAVESRPELNIIDPRARIMAGKPDHRMYPRLDSHWGIRGAYAAYLMLMERIKQDFPVVRPVTLDDYDIKTSPEKGDLALLLNLYDDLTFPEESVTFRGTSHIVKTENIGPQPGSGWPVKMIETDLDDQPRILIQGDSFTDYVLGPLFLYETFKNPVYIHHNGTELNKPLIEKVKPDIVVLELAERYLMLP